MTDTKTKILDIQVKYKEAIAGIADYSKEIRSATEAQKDLKAELKEGTISQEEYDRQMVVSKATIKQLKNEQAILEKQLRKNVEAENAEQDSLVQLRARLSNLTAEYDAMSGEMRDSAIGKALQDQINEVTDAIKGGEEATQRFYRNVGNYENSVREALEGMNIQIKEAEENYKKIVEEQGEMSDAAQEAKSHLEGLQYVMDFTDDSLKKLNASIIPFGDKLIPMLTKGMGGVKAAFSAAGQGAQILGKQFLALMANPIVAFLGLVAAAIATVVKGIQGSEENMNKWNLIIAPVNRGLAAMQNVLEKVCGWILNIVGAGAGLLQFFGKVIETATSGIPLIGDAVKGAMKGVEESIELEQRSQRLAEDTRKMTVETAKKELEVAELKKKANDTSNKNTEERLEASKKANEIERQLADERKRLATEEYNIAKQRSDWSGDSAKDKEELARLEAAMYNAEKDYYTTTMRLQSQQNSLEKSIADERKQRHQEAMKMSKERSDNEREAIRQAEDAMLQVIKDSSEKRRKEINLRYAREIDDLEKRLNEEDKLTPKAYDAITETIKLKKQQQAQELEALDQSISDQEIQRRQQKIQLMLDTVKVGSEQEYQLLLQQNQLDMEAEISATEQQIHNLEEREEMKALILAKYAEQERLIEKEKNDAIAEEQMLAIENRFAEQMMANEENSVIQAELEVEKRRQELEMLHQMEEETDEQFKARMLAAEQNYTNSKKNLIKVRSDAEQAELQNAKAVFGGIGKIMAAFGEENEAMAKMSKIIALAEIAIDTGKAIAAGTAQAMSVPYPANLAAIATTVATVLANVATAISTVKSAKFATGVVNLQGPGTGTSDSIPARLSKGESVMTANATKMFGGLLTIMNKVATQPNYTLPTTYANANAVEIEDSRSSAMRVAIEDIHPVVSVEEIDRVSNQVSAIENLDML